MVLNPDLQTSGCSRSPRNVPEPLFRIEKDSVARERLKVAHNPQVLTFSAVLSLLPKPSVTAHPLHRTQKCENCLPDFTCGDLWSNASGLEGGKEGGFQGT